MNGTPEAAKRSRTASEETVTEDEEDARPPIDPKAPEIDCTLKGDQPFEEDGGKDSDEGSDLDAGVNAKVRDGRCSFCPRRLCCCLLG